MNSDADYYVPPAFFLDQTGTWQNPLVRQSYEVPPVGEPKYNWHGLLLPALLALIPGKLEWSGVYRLLGLCNGLTLLFALLACRESLRNPKTVQAAWLGLTAAILAAAVLAAFLLAYNGRPEIIAVPWIALAAAIASTAWGRSTAAQPIFGLLLGLAALAAPIPAFGAGAAYVVWLARTRQGLVLFRHLALAALSGIARY
ncbi:MAG: hypothetical protein WEA84_14645 [Rhodovibrionaceae bacterium]